MGWRVGGLVGVLLLVSGCGEGTAPPADGGIELDPVDVDTVAPETVYAGQPLAISCLLIDATGEAFAPPAGLTRTLRFVPAGSVERTEDGDWIATRAGQVEVACTFDELRLTDASPAIIQVTPGDPATVVTHLDLDSIEAGELDDVTCEVFDAWGNPIEGTSPTARSEPADDGNTFDGLTGRFERSGEFTVYCQLPGATSQGQTLEVRPGLPASLVLSRVPFQPVYAQGQVIDIAREVHDRFGNPIPDAVVPVTSSPAGEQLGDGRFRYAEDGRYTLTARVRPPTQDDVPLERSTIVIVDGDGPAIRCDSPFDGEILDRTPSGTITFSGQVADISGVMTARVNGTSVPVNAVGRFEAEIPIQYGINFVDVAATDGVGREASRTCSFLVADTWAPDDRTFSDTLSLRMRQTAFDDVVRTDGLDSMADVLHTMLNSRELRDTIHRSLSASPTLKPSGCDSSVLGVCVLRSEVIYRDLMIMGPNTVTLTLVNGGMQANVRVEHLRVRIRVRGHVAGIPYDTEGWVTFDDITVRAILDASLSSGRPRIRVRSGSVTTNVGRISTDFSGLDGAIIDIVVDLFNGTVRNLVAGLVRDFVTNQVNDVLDGLIGGLDISSLGTSFEVPRLDDDATIPLTFGVGFSTLSTTSSRMLFGIGTRFFTPPAHARPTYGAPSRSGARLLDVSGTQSTAVGVHESLLNQALHALWRGGFFDATLDSSTISGVPAGVSATLSTGLPPVAEVDDDGRLRVSLGAVSLNLVYPDLFTEPIQVSLGARASMRATLVGEDLDFDDLMVEEIYFSTDLASLDAGTRDTIEGFLRRLLERILRPALNDALPAIPIPSFTLPASVSAYGLPAGAILGITSPALAMEQPHVVLRGEFAVR
ncbi:MAG: hypothetical protein H6719_23055 [Sandaracinaceae bacterium]|nr:hypothetical protein [Sandaracinaceae bacterium]